MFNKSTTTTLNRKEDGLSGSHSTPIRLTYAEDALRTMSLPEGALNIFLCLMQFSIPCEHMIIIDSFMLKLNHEVIQYSEFLSNLKYLTGYI